MAKTDITTETGTDFLDEVAKATSDKNVKVLANRVKRQRTGRPTVLTPRLASQIIKLVLEGNYPRVACESVGITKRTLDRWKSRAKEFLDDPECEWSDIPDEEKIFVEFCLMLQAAEGGAETRLLKRAIKGGKGWQAAMTVLERRKPDRWGRSEKRMHEISGDPERPVVIEVSPAEQRRAEVARVLNEAEPAIETSGREIIGELVEEDDHEAINHDEIDLDN